MNCYETNKVTMYQGVDAVFDLHQETISSLAPLAEAVGRYRGLIGNILESDQCLAGTTAGITAAKNSAARNLVDAAMFCAKALKALSVKTGNEPLKADVRITRSKLLASRNNVQLQICSNVIARAREYATGLAEYGVTPEAVNAVENAAEQLRKSIDEQTRKNAESKTARNLLYNIFDKIDSILKEELDSLIELVKVKDNSLYQHYHAVRKIKDLGHGHRTKIDASVVPPQPTKEQIPALAA